MLIAQATLDRNQTREHGLGLRISPAFELYERELIEIGPQILVILA